MKLKIPITGTVLREGSVWDEGELSGDPNDPIRLVDIDLGNVSWKMIDVDLENEVMVIEVSPAEKLSEPTGGNDAKGNPVYTTRLATQKEKKGFLQYAKDLVETHTKDELYAMAKCSRLKRPSKEKK